MKEEVMMNNVSEVINNNSINVLENTDKKENYFEDELNDNICFLCMESAQYRCEKCSLPYCKTSHYNLHISGIGHDDTELHNQQCCLPFRVLQRPEVNAINYCIVKS